MKVYENVLEDDAEREEREKKSIVTGGLL